MIVPFLRLFRLLEKFWFWVAQRVSACGKTAVSYQGIASAMP